MNASTGPPAKDAWTAFIVAGKVVELVSPPRRRFPDGVRTPALTASSPSVPQIRVDHAVPPVGVNFAAKAWRVGQLQVDAKASGFCWGKSLEPVKPNMYELPRLSKTKPLAVSYTLPPKYVEYKSEVPFAENFAAKASCSPPA